MDENKRKEYNRRRREAYRQRKNERRREKVTSTYSERRLHFVRVIMKDRHLSQSELAKRLGESRQAVHQLTSYDLAATTIAKAICGTIPQITSSDCGVLVPLTEELASHIVEMYNNTDWDELSYDSVSIPEDIFTGEMDVQAWKKHIGEHILISYFGSPWSDIMEAPAFIRGVTIDFSDHLLELAADYMDDLCSNDTMFRDLVDNLILGIQAKLADGIPEKALRRILELEFGSRKSQ